MELPEPITVLPEFPASEVNSFVTHVWSPLVLSRHLSVHNYFPLNAFHVVDKCYMIPSAYLDSICLCFEVVTLKHHTESALDIKENSSVLLIHARRVEVTHEYWV